MKKIITIAGRRPTTACAALAVASTGALAACGGTVTVHGTVTPNSAVAGGFGPGMNSTSYVGCAAASPRPGTQVTVTSQETGRC
jgi:hypothetical protein